MMQTALQRFFYFFLLLSPFILRSTCDDVFTATTLKQAEHCQHSQENQQTSHPHSHCHHLSHAFIAFSQRAEITNTVVPLSSLSPVLILMSPQQTPSCLTPPPKFFS
jgi:hypothetical protein